MDVRIYLLDLKNLRQQELLDEFLAAAPLRVDEERRRKAEKIRNPRGRAVSLGAGLLLQRAVADFEGGDLGVHDFGSMPPTALSEELCAPEIFQLSVRELMDRVKEPIGLGYRYGELGKPYFKNVPLYFNLSHSGDFVLCTVSKQEIGADIQKIGKSEVMRTAERFFAEGELVALQTCRSAKERTELFYRLWSKKEAYGKLTGKGIAEAISENMQCKTEVEWLTFEVPEGYAAAVCQKKFAISQKRGYREGKI